MEKTLCVRWLVCLSFRNGGAITIGLTIRGRSYIFRPIGLLLI